MKWFLQTWFIAIIFAFTAISPAFLLIGAIFLILQFKETQKLQKKYGTIDQLDYSISYLDTQVHSLERDKERLNSNISLLKNNISSLNDEIASLDKELAIKSVVKSYDFSEYDGISSEECRNKLALLKQDEKDLIKNDDAIIISSSEKAKKINNNCKQILRCFNAECDNILVNLSYKNIDTMRNKISASFESLNKIFGVDGIQLRKELLELKLEELNLVYTYEIKREQEHEQQKAIKEQMIEEEKVRREIERQKAKIEKDQAQCNKEINKLMAYMQKTKSDIEKQLYIDKIKELEQKLSELEKEKETVLEREANARAGFVYVISNIGSFGDDIYKIGMTRRLEPMDRIKELSSASVPFPFDVHAMIFSDDAPALETTLHQHFEKQSVNKVNLKKEFFHVSLDEIEKIVKDNFNNTTEFIKVAPASEYRQSLELSKQAAN